MADNLKGAFVDWSNKVSCEGKWISFISQSRPWVPLFFRTGRRCDEFSGILRHPFIPTLYSIPPPPQKIENQMRHPIPTLRSPVTLFAAHVAIANAACPPPGVQQGSRCVPDSDSPFTNTMWITSGTHLDCQGYRLTPMIAGFAERTLP